MAIEQLMFTASVETSDERPSTMVMIVDAEVMSKYRKDKTVPLVEVFDSFQVFKFGTPGKEGKLVKPSDEELKSTFGTTNDMAIAEFMAKKGEMHGSPHTHGEVLSGNDLNGLKGH